MTRTCLFWIVLKSHLVVCGPVHLLLAKLEVRSSQGHLGAVTFVQQQDRINSNEHDKTTKCHQFDE